MNPKIFNHVRKYNESKGYGTTEEDIIETIREASIVWESSGDTHRWYIAVDRVVNIDGMYIGFEDYITTGDMSARDMGINFKVDSIKEYEPIEEVITTYIIKKGE